ncbi:UvrD-helicase domain-containing protein [Synergistaceae bacterium OttesenSCG-928-I11]|nr:UvrD-helicase domain-containing protein [Synergistaceae bacterium OttesenSCG-928-I11]
MTRTNEDVFLHLISDARAEQQEAIRSSVPLTVVSAGAGTGKTHTLARRFAWLLVTDPTCRVDQILTLTFTQLAADEMRTRIRDTLTVWYESDVKNFSHLRDAIVRIDEAYISTIHSFALRVIRETGLELDIDPGASLVSEPVERDFWDAFVWNLRARHRSRILAQISPESAAWAEGILASDGLDAFLSHFDASLVADLARSVGEVFGSMNLGPDFLSNFGPEQEEAVRNELMRIVAPVCREVWDLWQGRILPTVAEHLPVAKSGVFVDKMRRFCEEWYVAGDDDEMVCSFLAALISGPLASLPSSGELKRIVTDGLGMPLKEWRDAHKAYGLLASTLVATPRYGDDERSVRRTLLGMAAIGWEAWERAKREMGVLSFSDLVRYAGRILTDNTSYANRFRHVMIDEFQDTDGLQDKMIRALTAAWDAKAPRTLFVVGDIKQSIYRFRHANPMLFARYIDRAARGEGALHIPLSYSFRMNGCLMRDVNAVFGTMWRDGVISGVSDVEAARSLEYEPLLPPEDAPWWDARNAGRSASQIEILLHTPDDEEAGDEGEGEKGGKNEKKEKKNAAALRARLALGIADRLSELIESGEVVWDKRERAHRPAAWGDMAVLVPTRIYYPALEEAFEARGVPVVFARSMQYYNRGEVQDMVNLLRALNDPGDDFALSGWIESPFSGCRPLSATALLDRVRGSALGLERTWAAAHPHGYGRFANLRRIARLRAPSEAVLALLEDPFWLDAYPEDSRPRVVANLRRGVDVLREYEGSLGKNLAAESAYLASAMRGGVATEEPDFAGEGENAVRVMTVHASKGLEFPIVVVMGMEAVKKKKNRSRARISRSLGVVPTTVPSLASGGGRKAAASPSVTALWDDFLESIREEDEYKRQMYVAMTRAQERLICAGVSRSGLGDLGSGKGDCWLDWLLEANARNGNPFPVSDVKERAKAKPMLLQSTRNEVPVQEEPIPAAGAEKNRVLLSPPRLAKFSASAYSLLSWCPLAYRYRYRQGLDLKWEMPDGDGYGGADLGSLAHWVLRKWELCCDSLERYLPVDLPDGELEGLLRATPPFLRAVYAKRRNRAILFEWLCAFSKTDTCAALWARKSEGALLQEIAFSVPLDGTTLAGSIDVYWEDTEGAHIRDWKITREERAPIELYEEQLDFYALACHLLKPEMPLDVGLIYLRPDETSAQNAVRRIADWDECSAKVARAAGVAVTGPFEGDVNRCNRCPFSRFCALKMPN